MWNSDQAGQDLEDGAGVSASTEGSPWSHPEAGSRAPASDISANEVIEMCAVGLALLDMDGQFRQVNRAFCELTGHSQETLSGTGIRLDQLLHPEEVASYQHHLGSILHGEEQSYRHPQRLLRQDGALLWIDLTVNLTRKVGGVPGYLVATAVDITEQRRTESAFRDMSFSDPLTSLPNRRLLRDRLQSAMARAKRDGRSVALLFIDLDGFKPINDSMGHATGDWLLKAVAQRLGSCLREYDTAARLGGDEFVVLLANLAQREDAERVAERIRAELATPFIRDDGKQLSLSASIGVSLYPAHAQTERALLHASDEAMYVAKKSGRNRIAFADECSIPTPMPVTDANSGLVHLTWEARFASGNAFIDAEHRELFQQSNRLLEMTTRSETSADEVHAALVRLIGFVDAHFRHEERILAQAGYPDVEAHSARHRRLMERAQNICNHSIDQSILIADILSFVVAEMIHGHIVTEDREYFSLVKSSVAD